uniref:DUF6241 domain-containing protein n=1 Tax=Siminovitchia sp. FSL W7-1587 TaxID=2954699 RepID=UPI00403E88B7
MTHLSKVRAEQKWGLSLKRLTMCLQSSQRAILLRKEECLALLDGDFSRGDEDHNYLWSYQGGTIGKVYHYVGK